MHVLRDFRIFVFDDTSDIKCKNAKLPSKYSVFLNVTSDFESVSTYFSRNTSILELCEQMGQLRGAAPAPLN